MKKVSFLHCSDIHLDTPFKYLKDSKKSAKRRNDLQEVFDHIVKKASEKGVDLLLISGDLYEHDYTSRATILRVRDSLSQIPEVTVVMIPGNHDPFSRNSFYSSIDWPENTHILNADNPVLYLHDGNTGIYGLGWENDVEEGINRISADVDQSRINILLFHGTVDMLFGKKEFNSVSSERLSEPGMDYIAVGHFHSTYRELGPAKNVFNPGSPEPLAFDQSRGDKGVFLGNIAKDETGTVLDVSFLITGRRRCYEITISLDGDETLEQVRQKIVDSIEKTGRSRDLYRVILRGHLRDGLERRIKEIAVDLSRKLFFIEIADETSPESDYGRIKMQPGIKGVFCERMLEKIQAAGSEKEKRKLEKALRYGMQALDKGKVDLGD